MFEKESERYAEKNETRGGGSSFGDETNYHDLRQAFKDGAEFSYNKCIAVLKCECRRCVYTDSPCILSDYGKDKNGLCDHFKDVFDEIAELKEQIEKMKCCENCNNTWNGMKLEICMNCKNHSKWEIKE